MAGIKGKALYLKWREGKKLTRGEALLAHCYICNGADEGGEDCLSDETCPSYQYFPYKGVRKK